MDYPINELINDHRLQTTSQKIGEKQYQETRKK
jgi:hypothetical protein